MKSERPTERAKEMQTHKSWIMIHSKYHTIPKRQHHYLQTNKNVFMYLYAPILDGPVNYTTCIHCDYTQEWKVTGGGRRDEKRSNTIHSRSSPVNLCDIHELRAFCYGFGLSRWWVASIRSTNWLHQCGIFCISNTIFNQNPQKFKICLQFGLQTSFDHFCLPIV